MNLDFIPRDYLVYLHPVEPVAGVGITAIAALLSVLIADKCVQVPVMVIGKTAFDVLPCLFVVYILVGIRQPRETVVGKDVAVLSFIENKSTKRSYFCFV